MLCYCDDKYARRTIYKGSNYNRLLEAKDEICRSLENGKKYIKVR